MLEIINFYKKMKSKKLCKKKRAQSGSIPGRLCSRDMEREFTQT